MMMMMMMMILRMVLSNEHHTSASRMQRWIHDPARALRTSTRFNLDQHISWLSRIFDTTAMTNLAEKEFKKSKKQNVIEEIDYEKTNRIP